MSYRDVTIRRAGLADEAELTALAALDDAPPLAGETLLAEVDGGVWAALSLGDGRVVSDPFRPAAEARAARSASSAPGAALRAGVRDGAWRRLLPTRALF